MRLSQVEYAKLEQEFMQQARAALRSVFGADEQPQLITLTQREERVLEAGAKLESWLLTEHLRRDPLADPVASEALRCPVCRTVGVREQGEAKGIPRALQTRAGPQMLARTKYRCPSCRKVFFPLGPAPATGPGELQSRVGAADRAAGREGQL